MDAKVRDKIVVTARRVRFLLPLCSQKGRLSELLGPAPRIRDYDDVEDGRTHALLGCLDRIREALSNPSQVPPRHRAVARAPTSTVMLALLESLVTRL